MFLSDSLLVYIHVRFAIRQSTNLLTTQLVAKRERKRDGETQRHRDREKGIQQQILDNVKLSNCFEFVIVSFVVFAWTHAWYYGTNGRFTFNCFILWEAT